MRFIHFGVLYHKRRRSRFVIRIRVIYLVLVLVLLCSAVASAGYQSPGQIYTNPRVLLISSYHPGFPTFFQQINGVKSVLSPDKVNLDIEFVDAKRFSSPEDIREFSHIFSRKIQQLPAYDLILVADDNALNLVLAKKQELFNNTPVVFFGINDQKKAELHDTDPLITGVMESVSMKETIDLMIRLNPESRSIIALSDDTVSGRADAATFLGYNTSYPGYTLTVLSLANLTWSEYALKLQKINQSSSVLLLSAYQDKTNKSTNFEEGLKFIKENLPVPLYHLRYHGMGDGIMGGVLISQYEQGRNAALIADHILKGTPPSWIPVMRESPNVVVFDYNEMSKFGIEPSALPSGSTIINHPVSIFDEYRVYILVAFLIIICLTILLIVMVITIRRRRLAEQALLKYQGHLEEMVEARTRELNQSNTELNTTQKKLQQYVTFLTLREKDLHKSEEKFRNLVEDINNILVTFTPEGIVTYVNPYAEHFFGYTAAELIGKHLIGTIIPEDLENPEGLNRFVSDLGTNPDKFKQHENANLKKSGEEVWILWTNRAIRDDYGKVISVISVGSDITERRKLEAAIQEANVKLSLLSTITRHDLLNTMTSIIGYLHIINENPDDNQNSVYLKLMGASISKMRKQIEFTRDYQEIGIKKPGWHDVGVLFRQVNDAFSETNIRFSCDITGIEIYGDNMLEKVFFNLIENSLRHGKNVSHISMRMEEEKGGVVLVYTDDGVGIADDEKELVFEKGFGKNTGLGMFLVREILHITTISIIETGRAGNGVRFDIHVPDGMWRRFSNPDQ